MKRVLPFLSYLIGLLALWIFIQSILGTIYVIKYDYVLQHTVFYEEFLRLTEKGLPFWSWNSFLGLNFWASKSYYLIGDPYAWLGILIKGPTQSVFELLTTLLKLKFIMAYTGFYLLSKEWKLQIHFRILLSLVFVFSGWNLVFMEHTMYTSFYSLLPFLFFGIERFVKHSRGFWVYTSVAALVAINFYLFWVASCLVLIYWIFRYSYLPNFDIKAFFKKSFGLLFYYILGVLSSSIIWYPSILHLMQSQRIGQSMIEYSSWTNLNIASFLTFSMIPMLKYLDGVFKDYWYYFNQVGLYISLFAWFAIPQALFTSRNKKEFFSVLGTLMLLALLLVSPKIGLFFHFTYSLRYTLIHTVLGLILCVISLRRFSQWKWWGVLVSEALIVLSYWMIQSVFLPQIHSELPPQLAELELLKQILYFSFIYAFMLLGATLFKGKKFSLVSQFFQYALMIILVFELATTSKMAFKSQTNEFELPYSDQDLMNAIDYLSTTDPSVFRIFTDQFTYSNISLAYDFMSNATYDTTYEYSLSEFLHWTRQYPESNWEFQYTDPTLTEILDVKYAIVRSISEEVPMTDPWFSDEIALDQDFGQYHILKYKADTAFAKTYSSIKDISELNKLDIESTEYRINELAFKLKNNLYMDTSELDIQDFNPEDASIYLNPTVLLDNHIEFEFETSQPTILMIRMPYDGGWIFKDQEKNLDVLKVQGGFVGLKLDAGSHLIVGDFMPIGFDLGKKISIISIIAALGVDVLLVLIHLTFKRLKP